MSLSSDIQALNRMLSSLRVKQQYDRRGRKRGSNRAWIIKNLPVRPVKIARFLEKAELEGRVRNSVYMVLIRMIDEGEVAENRFHREIWRPNGRKVWHK